MSQTPPSGQVATVKPKANVYTVMVIIAILALGAGIAFCLHNLMTPYESGGYGMKFDQLFKKWEPPPGVDAADGGGAAKKSDSAK